MENTMENSNTEFKHRGLLWKKVEPQDSETESWQYGFFFNLEKDSSLFATTKKFRWTLHLHRFRAYKLAIDSEISEPFDVLNYLLHSEHRVDPVAADYGLECLRRSIDESMIKALKNIRNERLSGEVGKIKENIVDIIIKECLKQDK